MNPKKLKKTMKMEMVLMKMMGCQRKQTLLYRQKIKIVKQ